MDIQKVFQKIEEEKEELFQLLSSLVKIDSQNFSSYGNEKEICEYIDGLCRDMGLESVLYSPMELEGFADHPDYMPNHGLENRYNVTAKWQGAEDTNALMLMAHSDTVQFGDPANWELPPTSGAIRDGKIYGRGSGDDKSGIAVMLFVTKVLMDLGYKPKKNLLLNIYCDEEYGGSHGALAAVLRDPCERVANLDASTDVVVNCATGGGEMKYRFHAKDPVDSSYTVARAMSTVMDVLDIFKQNRFNELEANRFYAGTVIPGSSMRYIGVKAGENGQDLGVGEIHFVYYTDKSKEEIAPEFETLNEMLKERLAPLGMVSDGFHPTTRFFHFVSCEPDCQDILDYVEAAKLAGAPTPLVCGGGLGDQSVIAKYGTKNAFSVGPIRSFEQAGGAHQPNEYVECDKLVEFTKTIAAYVLKVLQ